MGCRGGELSGPEIAILQDNTEICEHLKKQWKLYTYWADGAVKFCVDNEGERCQPKDILPIIETAVKASAAKTGLSPAWRRSELKSLEEFVSLIARAVYESPNQCSKTVTKILEECRGAGR